MDPATVTLPQEFVKIDERILRLHDALMREAERTPLRFLGRDL